MEKRIINLTIDGRSYQIKEGKTILESCKELGISIPSLCYLKDISSNASCGICVVELKGAKIWLEAVLPLLQRGWRLRLTLRLLTRPELPIFSYFWQTILLIALFATEMAIVNCRTYPLFWVLMKHRTIKPNRFFRLTRPPSLL
jgi:NADH dehydrogenase/NADH:ubiquinone oxidoreductase 75 kD subunit (chain G)